MPEEFIFTKSVDMSSLYEGVSIPIVYQHMLYEKLGYILLRGEQRSIPIVINDVTYFDATIKNQAFDEIKYPNRADIVQIRYSRNSPLAQTLRGIFFSSATIVDEFLINRSDTKEKLIIPEEQLEYINVHADKGVIRFDCIPRMTVRP